MAQVTKDRLWRGGRVTNHLSRLRHYRGKGIHSPYIYSIVRNVFMFSKLHASAAAAFEQLHQHNIEEKHAIEIANLATHCNFNSISFDGDGAEGIDMQICSESSTYPEIVEFVRNAAISGTAIVVLQPYSRMHLCNKLLTEHRGTSIDRFSYLVLFNNHLPKQHFKL